MLKVALVVLMTITNTSFLSEWAQNPARIIVAKLTYLVNGSSTTSYVGTKGFRTDPLDTPADELVGGNLLMGDEGPSSFVLQLSGYNPWMQEGPGGSGGVDLVIANDDGALDAWADYDFRDQVQELYLGFDGDLFTDFVKILTRYSGDIVADEDRFLIPLSAGDYLLSVPYQTARFSGEANAGVNGRPKPKALGNPRYVPPALVDANLLEYQIHDSADVSIDKVFADGYELRNSLGVAGVWDAADEYEAGDFSVTLSDNVASDSFTPSSFGEYQTTTEDGFSVDWTDPPEREIYSEFRLQSTISVSTVSQTHGTVVTGGFTWDTVGGASPAPSPAIYVSVENFADSTGYTSSVLKAYIDGTFIAELYTDVSGIEDIDVGIALDIPNGLASFYVKSALVAAFPYDFPTTSTDTIRGWVQMTESITGGTGSMTFSVTGRFDNGDWLYRPDSLFNPETPGSLIEFTKTEPEFALVYNPQGSKITAHIAAHSPQGFESWSAPDGTISGADSRTVEGKSGSLVGHILPMPRSFGDLCVEIECDSVNNTNAPEIGLTSWSSTDTIATRRDVAGDAHRDRAALWADGGAFRINGTTAATVGGGFATASTVGFRTDRDNNALYLYEDGVELGGGSSPFTLTDMIRDPAKDGFTATDYYELDDGEVFADSADTLTIAMRVNVEAGTANRYLLSLDGNVVRLFVTATEAIRIQTRDSSPATITDHQTSALSGWVSVLISLNAKSGACQIYVDDVSDVTTTVGTGGTIDWNVNECDIGAATAGVLPLLEGEIQMLGVATGVAIDISVEENRRRFFREDGYPSELAGYNGQGAFGKVPEIWIVDGDATANRGSKGAFTEIGTVGDTDAPGDRYAPIAPIVFTNDATDQFTIRTNAEDMTHFDAYGGAVAWGEVWALPECINVIADGNDDLENNFLAVCNAGFAPALGYYNERDRLVPDVLDWLALSNGFFRFWDRNNKIRIADMADPESLVSIGSFDREYYIGTDVIRRELDRAEGLTANIAGWKIWAPHGSNEIVGAVPVDTAELIQQTFGIITAGNVTGLADQYAHAQDAPALATLQTDGEPLDEAVGRSTEVSARRILGLYCCQRYRYIIPNAQRFALGTNDIEPGKAITLPIDRFGLSGGKKLLVLDVAARDYDAAFDLVAWG